jgi:magnesium chelatase family protein
VSVAPVDHDQLLREGSTRNEHEAAQRAILDARTTQAARFGEDKTNALLTNADISRFAHLATPSKLLLDKASKSLNLSARAYFKTIKVSRTIADLDKNTSIEPRHVSEALQYRPRFNTTVEI